MFTKIVAVIWILLGLLWLAKPEMLKNKLRKKMSRKVRWTVFGFVIVLGLMLTGSALRMPGLLAKILGLIGIIIAIRAALLFTSKTSGKILNKLLDKPIIFFRIGAALMFATGIALLLI